jgi:hypothetical protein
MARSKTSVSSPDPDDNDGEGQEAFPFGKNAPKEEADHDAEAIRRELDDLEKRQDALRILYRVAVRRRRKRDQQQQQRSESATIAG